MGGEQLGQNQTGLRVYYHKTFSVSDFPEGFIEIFLIHCFPVPSQSNFQVTEGKHGTKCTSAGQQAEQMNTEKQILMQCNFWQQLTERGQGFGSNPLKEEG